ncbi:Uncharacterized membrane protein YbhN, UPF0104 family [Loktanella sp. DSM 29012]|uniref:lysylphosphatidylglycerol synthase transmembrane domain-containing protein n=1 Tax=Loktanella sp. DSM 29012 TaxID=1881056 RepID=UPI0008B4C2D9|nr:lysylphosphatidylglycerol synthase transmembrane domain-containing protein [Loktanella sp. DSM 29012]SEQ79945.1 Uncharacterized membrane protein YbhN, UPF0104 family [Loktanella sp. DSM 29012]
MHLTLRLICVAALCLLLVVVVDTDALWDRLRNVQPGWIVAATLCLIAQTMLMAQRWRLVAVCLGVTFSYPWALREYLLSQTLNQGLPGGVLGDGARALRSAPGTGNRMPAAQAVILERAAGQLGLLAVAMIGLTFALFAPGALAAAQGFVVRIALAAVALCILGAVIAVVMRGSRPATLVRRCLPTWRIGLVQAGLSVAAALLNIAAFAACAQATGTSLDLPSALVLVPLILSAMLIPLSVGGWGWREGAAAVVFPLIGASAEAGIAAGVLFGAVMILSLLPALPLLIWRGAGRPVAAPSP